ncbi:hypothetical protein ACFX2I_020981 [Malus domestica]
MMGDKSNSFLSLCFRKRKCDSPSSKPLLQQKDEDLHQLLDPNTTKNKFGWKAMPYILGTFLAFSINSSSYRTPSIEHLFNIMINVVHS